MLGKKKPLPGSQRSPDQTSDPSLFLHMLCHISYVIQGVQWRIGNRRSVNLYGNKWLHTPHSFQLQIPPNLLAFEQNLKVFNLID